MKHRLIFCPILLIYRGCYRLPLLLEKHGIFLQAFYFCSALYFKMLLQAFSWVQSLRFRPYCRLLSKLWNFRRRMNPFPEGNVEFNLDFGYFVTKIILLQKQHSGDFDHIFWKDMTQNYFSLQIRLEIHRTFTVIPRLERSPRLVHLIVSVIVRRRSNRGSAVFQEE